MTAEDIEGRLESSGLYQVPEHLDPRGQFGWASIVNAPEFAGYGRVAVALWRRPTGTKTRRCFERIDVGVVIVGTSLLALRCLGNDERLVTEREATTEEQIAIAVVRRWQMRPARFAAPAHGAARDLRLPAEFSDAPSADA